MSKIYHPTVESPQYENSQVLNLDGQLMFRCSYKKAIWYFDRNLATKLNDDPLIVKLNFIPKGTGHIGDPYHLQEMKNLCVVCGSEENLTRHHIAPYCYRKFFPNQLKSHRSYDIMAMCSECHNSYESEASRLKKEIGIEYGIPPDEAGIVYDKDAARAKNAAYAIITFGSKIPPERMNELLCRVRDYFGREVTQEDLIQMTEKRIYNYKNYVHHGQYVVSQMTEDQIEPFVKKWRQHFIDTMEPKFLPKNWTVERPILYKV